MVDKNFVAVCNKAFVEQTGTILFSMKKYFHIGKVHSLYDRKILTPKTC